MSDFSFSRDYKKVRWGATLWLNLLRAFAAGVVIDTFILISGGNTGPNGPPLLAMPFVFPLAYLMGFPAYLIAVKIMTTVAGGFGELGVLCVSVIFGLVLAVGDPLIFALHKLKPALVPTEKFNLMNFTLCIWVLDPQKVAQDV